MIGTETLTRNNILYKSPLNSHMELWTSNERYVCVGKYFFISPIVYILKIYLIVFFFLYIWQHIARITYAFFRIYSFEK